MATFIHYQRIELKETEELFYVFSGNLELLKKFLDQHKNVLELVGKLTKGKLNQRGEEALKDQKLNETVFSCEDIFLFVEEE